LVLLSQIDNPNSFSSRVSNIFKYKAPPNHVDRKKMFNLPVSLDESLQVKEKLREKLKLRVTIVNYIESRK